MIQPSEGYRLQPVHHFRKFFRASQAAEKLKAEGVGGFNPRIKPTESEVALATEGQFSSIPPKFPSFSATCSAPEGNLITRFNSGRGTSTHA
jgi:hypothetical protein